MPTTEKSVAIACQGGGSHCAFGAGALITLLNALDDDHKLIQGDRQYRIVGVSGTSGGGINAFLTWYGLMLQGAEGCQKGVAALEDFWYALSARDPLDLLTNQIAVQTQRLSGVVPTFEMAPNAWSDIAQRRLLEQVIAQIEPTRLKQMLNDGLPKGAPQLLIGAADIQDGKFKTFKAEKDMNLDMLLASAAVPMLFAPVEIDGHYYIDGLFSENPPISEFISDTPLEERPDEIWVIRVNPMAIDFVPGQVKEIIDRRNEMTGNLSLTQEIDFINVVNKWLENGYFNPSKTNFRHIDVKTFACLEEKGHLASPYDYASKLDRRPEFIENLIETGKRAAAHFLEKELEINVAATRKTPAEIKRTARVG